jgi:uncharacterized protein YkwD
MQAKRTRWLRAGALGALLAAAGVLAAVLPSRASSLEVPTISTSLPATTAVGSVTTAVSSIAAPATATVSSTAAGATSAAKSSTASVQLSAADRNLVTDVNEIRTQRGRSSLGISAGLARAALAHALSMARNGYFSHSSSDGSPFWKRLLRYYPARGYARWRVGENLYWSTRTDSVAAITTAWLASPEHRRVLLFNWVQLGIAIVDVPNAPGVYGHRTVRIAVADFGIRSR